MRIGSRPIALALLLLASLLPWLGCSGTGGDITEPELGTLEVTTATSGPEPDPDGYTISIDGAAPETVGANAVLRRERVSVGSHSVEISGLAANCTVSGAARHEVDVAADEVATVAYAVTCAATTGSLHVTTTTEGPAGAEGYRLLLDGAEVRPIGAAAAETLAGLAPGARSVGLGGVAANCRVQGENPRAVTVVAGATAAVTFAVACDPPPPENGTVEVTTQTTGSGTDPDGYRFVIDGGEEREIGVNATVSVAVLSAGDHTVELREVASHCVVGGENPRSVTVPAGGTTQVAFGVTCSAATGSIRVSASTSGTPADPDGYSVSVDGATPRTLGRNASTTFDGVAPGPHSVLLAGLAANCLADGDNPRPVEVAAGETAQVGFAVACASVTGSLTVTIAGLPSGADAAVTVSGPDDFSRRITATRTFRDLPAGAYAVTASDVTAGGTRYTPGPATQEVAVTAGETASATVTYAGTGTTLNLRIEGWHLTQGVQTAGNDLPLVANRDGYLRVFVVADETNRVTPVVRVRIFRNGSLATTINIPAPGASTPTRREEEPLGNSWNTKIPRELIGPGLSLMAEVDPANAVPERNEGDNVFPLSGTPLEPVVRSASTLAVRFVPVRQQLSGLTGDVSDGNRGRYLDLTRKLFPLPGTDGDVHAAYTTDTELPLQWNNANGAWFDVLSEIDALRVAEGSARHYYGVVRIDYASGLAGMAFLGRPTAIGYDLESDRARVVAHELGHTWNRDHSPCGGPLDVDPRYPYPGGGIGVYGVDMGPEILKPPTVPDIMGYCGNPWISDYTYRAVMDYRAAAGAVAAASGSPQRALLVWGRIVDGRPVLEPAFEVTTRPTLPDRPGPYRIEARTPTGTPLFDLSFDAALAADDPRGGRHFAFAVPLPGGSASVGSLRLATPVGEAAAARLDPGGAAVTAPDAIVARRAGRAVALRWNGAALPMLMVRDPRTGEVLSFARGGESEIVTDLGEVEVSASDGVGSRRLLVPVAR